MLSNPNGAATNPELMTADRMLYSGQSVLSRLLSSDPMMEEQ